MTRWMQKTGRLLLFIGITALCLGWSGERIMFRCLTGVSAWTLPQQSARRGGWRRALDTTSSRIIPLGMARTAASKAKTVTEKPYHLLIVESPSKCATLEKILAAWVEDRGHPYEFVVEACYGHVCNLPKKGGSNATVAGIDLDTFQAEYVVDERQAKVLRNLQTKANGADAVWLATDPDREGEAMAWHMVRLLEMKEYQRLCLTEITPSAVQAALDQPRQLDSHLIQAQQARRVLDRLAGYTVSPILWTKICPGLSAGRVQSVGMALTVQRERERLRFISTEYATVEADFDKIPARLLSVNETQLARTAKDFDGGALAEVSKDKLHWKIDNATEWVERVLSEDSWKWTVSEIQSTRRQQQAPEPFRTSTLQQDASRRLGMSVSTVMKTAQNLYEQGFISYMRTDSTTISQEAEGGIKDAVNRAFGKLYVAGNAKKKAKHAQEAHEAVRPAIQPDGRLMRPEQVEVHEAGKKLYTLIYERTLACRMPPLVTNQTSVSIEGVNTSNGETVRLRASGSVVVNPGYTLAYGRTGTDDDDVLPPISQGQVLHLTELAAVPHETQPPPRFSEASFVKELESLGVGRPSTYAHIVQVLRDRAYVGSPTPSRSRKPVTGGAKVTLRAAGGEDFAGASGPLMPSLTAFVVCSLLEKHCPTYVDPAFTARMEEQLDLIALGEDEDPDAQRVAYLRNFYNGDEGLAAQIARMKDSVSADEARRASLPALDGLDESIGLFVGPWGPYIQQTTDAEKPLTAPLPAGMATDLSKVTPSALKALLSTKQAGGTLLGDHPDDARPILLKTGRFGAYLQWGSDDDEGSTTHSLPREKATMREFEQMDGDDATLEMMLGITLEEAVAYTSLPRTVSVLNDLPITAAIGPYGPYLKYNNTFVSLNAKDGDVISVDAATAERLVLEYKPKSSRGVLVEVGEMEGSAVTVKSGRYGAYINWKRVNAKLPPAYVDNPDELPLEEAWSLITEKAGSTNASDGKAKKATAKGKSDVDLPPPPKRPLSAYFHFCGEKRSEVAKTEGSLGATSKRLAELWKAISEDDKQHYTDLAQAGRAEYEAKKSAWQDECQLILEKTGGKTSSKRSASARSKPDGASRIKKNKSAYLHFCAEKRPEVSKNVQKLGEVSKELARLWAETTDRRAYESLAAADKERYQSEVAANESGVNGSIAKTALKPRQLKVVKTPTTSKNGQSRTKSSASPPRAPSAYMLFCREFRPTMLDEKGSKLPLGEATKQLALLWKKCDIQTKEKFQDMAAAEKVKLLNTVA